MRLKLTENNDGNGNTDVLAAAESMIEKPYSRGSDGEAINDVALDELARACARRGFPPKRQCLVRGD